MTIEAEIQDVLERSFFTAKNGHAWTEYDHRALDGLLQKLRAMAMQQYEDGDEWHLPRAAQGRSSFRALRQSRQPRRRW